jgi:POT family proton-dependent oligopeptide transporter
VSTQAVAGAGAGKRPGEFFGHPTCLFTLFFAEMWERFSFYGMKALLILYMVNYLFWRQGEASHVMALYAGLVYATPVFGGIIADKLTGARWAVVIGGVIIATGHFLLAFEPLPFFYSGLGCLIVGTGMLKPNISTQVGALYRSDDERRDSAFTIFYMGINLGAFIGPLLCGWLRLHYSYHHGFAAAGVGMVIGLIVYIAGMRSVVRREKTIADEEAAARDEHEKSQTPAEPAEPVGTEAQPAVEVPRAGGPSMSRVYLDRSIVLIVICIFAILFWVGFEQAANVMNLWADKHTNLFIFRGEAPKVMVADAKPAPETAGDIDATAESPAGGGLRDFQMTAEQSQSINPFFIITLAAVFAWFWQFLERRGKQPSTPMKMAFGVFFLSCAYGVMLMAASAENQSTSTALAEPPPGLEVGQDGVLYNVVEDDGETKEVYYGATRLRWQDGRLLMRGVLPDLHWMRALGATSSEAYQRTAEELFEKAEERAEEVRVAKQAGKTDQDATWQVNVKVPPELGELKPIAGWPTIEVDDEEVPAVEWDPQMRTLTAKATLSERGKAQVLAAGADPEFSRAVTEIYQESSTLRISIAWLLAFYLVITIGELCLSPVGLSLVTKAAPPKYVGLFMGFWFFTTGAVSNFLAHVVGGQWGTMTPAEYFIIFGVLGAIATVIMLLLLRVLKPLLHGVH